MEFTDNTVRKTGEPGLLAVEAAKGSKAFEIGRDSGLFYVPKVVGFDAETGVLEFERLDDLATLLELAVRKDQRLPGLLTKAGKALAVVHDRLVLPEEFKHELPPEWMAAPDENVFIHGDFACINVCCRGSSDELVILDWSAAPSVGRTPTFGNRYFDILLFISSLFHGAPYRDVLKWDAKGMADTFLRGYGQAAPKVKLSGIRKYSSKICRLQRKNIRHLARQRKPLRATGYIFFQALMHARLCRFLHKYEA